MLLNIIDKLLDRSFQKELDYSRLDGLESDVWAKIRQIKVATPVTSFMLPVWSNVQLRYACLALALIGGLVASQASIKSIPSADTLGLEIFSPNAPFLMTSTFEPLELTSS